MSDVADLLKIKLRLEFDGRGFCGWQIQSPDKMDGLAETEHLPSVQGVLEKSIATLLHRERGQRVTVQGCGRTDAGVHAREFFCHFEIEAAELLKTPDSIERLRYSLNCVLPSGVAVTHAERVPASFHALRDVSSKIYCYRILFRRAKATLDQGYCWWIPRVYDEQ